MNPYFENEKVTIYHGDCRDIVSGLPKVDLVLTDPPYAINAGRGEWSATAAVAIGLHESAKRVNKTGSMVVFTTTSGRGIEFTQGALAGKLPFNRMLTWSKTGGNSRAMSPWNWDSVAIMLFGRAPQARSGLSSVYSSSARYEKETEHPSELPEGLADWLYLPFDREGITILDPFMGSGRLLHPAISIGRRVIGIEIEEKYCEAAAKLMEQEAVLSE